MQAKQYFSLLIKLLQIMMYKLQRCKPYLHAAFIMLVSLNVSAQLSLNVSAQLSEKKPLADIKESAIEITGDRYTFPSYYRTLHLNADAMKQLLQQSPKESQTAAGVSNVIFEMPMPDGKSFNFRIYETSVLAPELAAQFPEIKTYAGQCIDDASSTIRLDMTPLGFHAMVLSPNGSVFIDPYGDHTTSDYICYYKKDLPPRSFNCEVHPDANVDNYRSIIPAELYAQRSAGTQLRTYRLALACTGEYAATKGGTISGALSGMTTSMNRVTGVYETEVAIRMTLIANETSIIYTNSSTDPYTNNNGGTMLNQNQSNLDAVIGTANYDIGHVFSTGGGGIAGLGVVCSSGNKARGVTGLPNPVGDAFDIDFVAHEMGHQFGANHTFNSTTGNCGGGNRASSAAYEPGSGITIMAYAGICGSDDLAPHSIAYFHTKSFDEISIYTTTGTGSTCPVTASTGNTAPVASVGGDFTIPALTPFVLTGSATDADGDALTYSWEQFDLGASGAWNQPQTASSTWPLFRPFEPTSSPSRTFPKLSDIINNTTTVGEVLPTVARTLHFRLTARDQHFSSALGRVVGGVNHPDNPNNITVVATGAAFAVTSPNTAVTWAGNSIQTVTWNVAGTTANGINCANVKISLSTDGGNNFNTVLLASTPNDGSESITVPNTATAQARIKVEAVGNIFFDMSNSNFTITAAAGLTTITTGTISPLGYCAGNPVSVPFTTNAAANAGNVFTAQLSDASGSFASPVSIGTLNSTAAGTIAATIPSNTPGGNGYRIRVVSSNPPVVGSPNASNISIAGFIPQAGPISSISTTFCANLPMPFSIAAIPNATTYTWAIPAPGAILSGQGTTSITIAYPPGMPDVSGNITVFGSNSNCDGAMSSLAITVHSSPNPSISGNDFFCAGSSTILDAGAGYSNYDWSTGATTQTITVNTANTFTVTVYNANGCTGTASKTTTVNPLPSVSFSGLAASYNVTDPSATLTGSPAGGTFSGPGISGNSFSPSSAGVGGPYTITYSYTNGNGCSNSAQHQTTVNNCDVPSQPGTITATGGNTKVCPGSTKTYSISAVAGATSYTWTPPTGGNIANGQGTTSVTINYTAGFTANGVLSVVANNSCGSSLARTLTINRNVPAAPSVITGSNYGVCNLGGVAYSVTAVSGMTYNWFFSNANATIASGQGTHAITANFNPSYVTGTLSVTANNACGTGPQRNLTVRATPATPASISGSQSVCANQQGVSYSTTAVATATSYTWSVPSGARINDGSTTSTGTTLTTNQTAVTVNFATTAGNVRVRANNNCGSGSYRSLAVSFVCRDGELSDAGFNLNCYPLPADDQLNLAFNASEEINLIRIIDVIGNTIYTRQINSSAGENKVVIDLGSIARGIYMIELSDEDKKEVKRIVIE